MKYTICFLFAACAALGPGAISASAEGIFPDKNLEAVVRHYVFEKRDNNEPIVAEDVENISTITGRGKGIKDLTGLEKCRSLALLELANNEIENIEPIAGLTNIQSLDLAENKIRDITPLGGLIKLQYIQLENNDVSDISPLSKLVNANSVYLTGNHVKDLTPLEQLTKVWSLYLDKNEVSEIATVGKLKNLTNLGLSHNQIKDLGPLRELKELKYLFLQHNQVSDLNVLIDMGQRDRAESPEFSLFWQIFLSGNPLDSDQGRAQLDELAKVAKKIEFQPQAE